MVESRWYIIDYKYTESIKIFLKTLIPSIVMIIVVFLLKLVIPVNYDNKISCIIYIAIIGILGAISYLFVAFKQGLLYNVFGKDYLNKIIKKITFNKICLK